MAERLLVGIDTPFLLAHTLLEHPDHRRALAWCEALLASGRSFALCPTVCEEFLHVVTDPKRFERPLGMAQAAAIVRAWMLAPETVPVFATEQSWLLQLDWLDRHRLGRKRILDTGIAAVYCCHGARQILTSNIRDYRIFPEIEALDLAREPVAQA